MMAKKIIVVGCGGIGSRHLQALGKISIPSELIAVDPNQKSLDNAKKIFGENKSNNNIKYVEFYKKIPDNIKNIDLCIIATSSDVRLDVLKELISKMKLKNLILEKILFQSEEQFNEAKEIVKKNKINCWVNCFRREEEFWKKIKDYFSGNSNIKIKYGKPDGNLCTNSIHVIDLSAWILNDKIKQVNGSGLDKTICESKREGFIELRGILEVRFEKGGTCRYESIRGNSKESAEFEISSDSNKLVVNEMEGRGIIYRRERGWKSEKINFHILHQSEKTQKVVEKILDEGKCNLTSLNESSGLHIPLIRCFMKHLNNNSNSKYTQCPIT